ncbi:MAG: DUF4157 domain-containing protein [Crocosphaera sp.]|nr:DUF4157 domain-containing protein [Crocosphaera sp.]
MANFRDAAPNEGPFSAAFATAGERWKQAAILFGQRLIPKRKWTQFAATVQARHAAVKKFEGIETRIRDGSRRSPKNKRSSLPDEAEALMAAAESNAAKISRNPYQEQRKRRRKNLHNNSALCQNKSFYLSPPAYKGFHVNLAAFAAESPVAETRRSPKNKRSSLPHEAEALIAAAASPVGELPPAVKRSSHFLLDARLKHFLAGFLNIRIPAVKIYTNQAADRVTRSYGADALTYQEKILFRAGKYKPRETAGIALLGHELTHAAQVKMESPSKPGQLTQPILDTQEQQALANEAKVWQHLSSPSQGLVQGKQTPFPDPIHPPVPGKSLAISRSRGSGSGNRQINQIQSGQPRTALSSRELNLPPETNTALSSSPYLSTQQLNQIKEEVYRDLMDRIRIEFERGG